MYIIYMYKLYFNLLFFFRSLCSIKIRNTLEVVSSNISNQQERATTLFSSRPVECKCVVAPLLLLLHHHHHIS